MPLFASAPADLSRPVIIDDGDALGVEMADAFNILDDTGAQTWPRWASARFSAGQRRLAASNTHSDDGDGDIVD